MSRIASVTMVLAIVGLRVNAQPEFSVSVKAGLIRPEGKTHELGFWGKASALVGVTDYLIVSLSGGYQRWEDKPDLGSNPYVGQHSFRLYIVSLGASYRFYSNSISPYISGELEYLDGTQDGTLLLRQPGNIAPTLPKQFHSKLSELGSVGSLGLLIPLGKGVLFDVAGSIRLTASSGALGLLGLTGGLRVSL